MKKLAFGLAATAAFAGQIGSQAIAADMPAQVSKTPPPVVAPVANWTGCYVGGGGGYGLFHQENTGHFDGPPRVQISDTFSNSGKGGFGTVQGGCDYQFNIGTWGIVVGGFADYDFADINGKRSDIINAAVGNVKLSSQWAVGGRVGMLVNPQLLTFVTAGYVEAKFDRTNWTNLFGPPFNVANGFYTDGSTFKGWFLGTGDEWALSFLPGLYWKNEYRASHMDRQNQPVLVVFNGARTGISYDAEKWIHTVRTELVYRFNWGGPIGAKY